MASKDIFPTTQILKVREPIRITCFSHTKPKWTYSGYYMGFLKTDIKVKKKIVFENNIFIKHASKYTYNGVFTCQGSDKSGQSFNASARVIVGSKSRIIF